MEGVGMNRQFVVFTALCTLMTLVSITEAGIFGRRQSSNRQQTYNYTYRPTTTVAQPAPATTPAAEEATEETSDKVEAKPASVSKPEAPKFHPTILSMLARNNATRTSRGLR